MSALSALVTLPPFLASYEMIGNMWVFVGSPGYGAHLHLDDDLDTNTWQAQAININPISSQIFIPEFRLAALRLGSWSRHQSAGGRVQVRSGATSTPGI